MKRKIYIISTICITLAILFFVQKLLIPKYVEDNPEGALISEYYDVEKDHDLLFVGDCEVYESFSPEILRKEYGIKSYIRGSANQLIWQSYYLLEEMLKYEKPKTVVYNVLAMKYARAQKESYNRMTLDGMRWSASLRRSLLHMSFLCFVSTHAGVSLRVRTLSIFSTSQRCLRTATL